MGLANFSYSLDSSLDVLLRSATVLKDISKTIQNELLDSILQVQEPSSCHFFKFKENCFHVHVLMYAILPRSLFCSLQSNFLSFYAGLGSNKTIDWLKYAKIKSEIRLKIPNI